MIYLGITLWLYLLIGMVIASIIVFNKNVWEQLIEYTYKFPLPSSKIFWFALISIFWVTCFSVKFTGKKEFKIKIKE
jgi:hypothetical protein